MNPKQSVPRGYAVLLKQMAFSPRAPGGLPGVPGATPSPSMERFFTSSSEQTPSSWRIRLPNGTSREEDRDSVGFLSLPLHSSSSPKI